MSEHLLTCTFDQLCLQSVDEHIEIQCRTDAELKRKIKTKHSD